MRQRVLALATVLLLFAGCDDPATPNPNAHVGRYEIVSVNGENLPFLALVVDGRTTHILAGSVTLNANGTASDTYTFRYTDGPEIVEETTYDEGSYTRDDGFVDVVWSSGAVESFVHHEDELTLSENGLVVTYRK